MFEYLSEPLFDPRASAYGCLLSSARRSAHLTRPRRHTEPHLCILSLRRSTGSAACTPIFYAFACHLYQPAPASRVFLPDLSSTCTLQRAESPPDDLPERSRSLTAHRYYPLDLPGLADPFLRLPRRTRALVTRNQIKACLCRVSWPTLARGQGTRGDRSFSAGLSPV